MEITSATGALGSTFAVLPLTTPDPDGVLTLSNNVGSMTTAVVTWDANGDGLGGVDLTGLGADSIGIELVSLDLVGAVDLTVTIKDIDGDIGSLLLVGANIGQNVFDFNSFVNAPNVDFNLVDFISITLDSIVVSADLSVDFFETLEAPPAVPEPTTIALLGIGLVGFGGGYLRKRFRRKSQV